MIKNSDHREPAQSHNLDLVISVDTATAHLCGAMGKPVWLMLEPPTSSDWRWLREGKETVWYPSAKLFRQEKAGDWKKVISEIKQELSISYFI